MSDKEFNEDEFWESEYMHQAYIHNMKKAQNSKLHIKQTVEEKDDKSIITVLLRQNEIFFTTDEHELFDDKEAQYELLLNLLIEKGELICELEWDADVTSDKKWMRKIGDYYFVNDGVEPLYGPFNSLDAAFENCDTCRYISDTVKSIYLNKPADTIDWIIAAKDNHVLMINSEEYIIQNKKLLKITTYNKTQNNQKSNKKSKTCDNVLDDVKAECRIEADKKELQLLIAKFNEDDTYRRYIINKGNSMIVSGKEEIHSVEDYFAMLVLNSKY